MALRFFANVFLTKNSRHSFETISLLPTGALNDAVWASALSPSRHKSAIAIDCRQPNLASGILQLTTDN